MTTNSNPIPYTIPVARPYCEFCGCALAMSSELFWVDARYNQDSDPTDHVHKPAAVDIAEDTILSWTIAANVSPGMHVLFNAADFPTDDPIWLTLRVVEASEKPADEHHTDLIRLVLDDGPYPPSTTRIARYSWEVDVLPECVIKHFLQLP